MALPVKGGFSNAAPLCNAANTVRIENAAPEPCGDGVAPVVDDTRPPPSLLHPAEHRALSSQDGPEDCAVSISPTLRTSLVRIQTDNGGAARGRPSVDSPDVLRKQEAFWRWGRTLGFTDAAIKDWLDLADHPGACVVLVHAGGAVQVFIFLVTFVWASKFILYRHVLAYFAAANALATNAGVWRYGPHFLQARAKVLPPLHAASVLALMTSGLLSFGSSDLPFRSEILYILVISALAFVMNVGGFSILPAIQKMVRHMTLLDMSWTGLVRTARIVDSVSDIGFAINLVVKISDVCSGNSAACGKARALGGVSCFLAAADCVIAWSMTLLGKDFQTRKDLGARRALLSFYACSACCEVGMLTVHCLVAFSSDPAMAALASSTNMRLYIAYSALTTIVSLVGNIVGARRLLKLAYVVATTVPTQIKAAVAHASNSRNSALADEAASRGDNHVGSVLTRGGASGASQGIDGMSISASPPRSARSETEPHQTSAPLLVSVCVIPDGMSSSPVAFMPSVFAATTAESDATVQTTS